MHNSLAIVLAKKQDGKQSLTSVRQAFQLVMEHCLQALVCYLPLKERLRACLSADLVLVTGGASAGPRLCQAGSAGTGWQHAV